MKAVIASAHGGPEVLRVIEAPTPALGDEDVLVRVEAIGINFIDIYHRSGLYKLPLPVRLGLEGAGTAIDVGSKVRDVRAGDRVAWASAQGSYATELVVPASRLVVVPAGVDSKTAAAAMLQGMTAHYLAHSTFPLGSEHVCLVHAAAGGVGLLLCQMAKRAGARVIGTTSTESKAALAREAGADDIILYDRADVVAEVRRLTGGQGVHVVFDSVGKSTFDASLASLRPRGMLVTFGQSSGPVPPFDVLRLGQSGSLFLTRAVLGHYTATRDELVRRASDVLGWIAEGSLRVRIHEVLPLAQAAQAHRLLESRATSGKVLLTP